MNPFTPPPSPPRTPPPAEGYTGGDRATPSEAGTGAGGGGGLIGGVIRGVRDAISLLPAPSSLQSPLAAGGGGSSSSSKGAGLGKDSSRAGSPRENMTRISHFPPLPDSPPHPSASTTGTNTTTSTPSASSAVAAAAASAVSSAFSYAYGRRSPALPSTPGAGGAAAAAVPRYTLPKEEGHDQFGRPVVLSPPPPEFSDEDDAFSDYSSSSLGGDGDGTDGEEEQEEEDDNDLCYSSSFDEENEGGRGQRARQPPLTPQRQQQAGSAAPQTPVARKRDGEAEAELSSSPLIFHAPPSGRQYWMPDRLCRACYDCEQPFTMLRRRHHCRFCGQVFCSQCSGFYVDGAMAGLGPGVGSVRCCRLCLEQVPQLATGNSSGPLSSSLSMSHQYHHPHHQQQQQQQQLPPSSPLLLSPARSPERNRRRHRRRRRRRREREEEEEEDKEREEEEEDVQGSSGRRKQGKRQTKSKRGRRGKGKRAPQPLPLPPLSPSRSRPRLPRIQRPSAALLALAEARARAERERQQLLLQQQAAAATAEGGGGGGGAEGEESSISLPPLPPPLSIFEKALLLPPPPLQPKQQQQQQQQEEEEEEGGGEDGWAAVLGREAEAANARALSGRAEAHWRAMVQQLVEASPVLPTERKAAWAATISELVATAVRRVDPDVRGHGDQMDARSYVKVKVVPGGSMEECHYVDGLVFRKNVAHKAMAGCIPRPRVLLLSGGVEFHRTESRMASLDVLVDQEARYTQILVDKLLALQPDLILAGKAVSRQAQELLTRRRVALMQHVKPQTLERLSRLTGARILASTDHVTALHGAKALGTCGQFRLATFRPEIPSTPHLQAQTQQQLLQQQQPQGGEGEGEEGRDSLDDVSASGSLLHLPPPVFTPTQQHQRRPLTYAYIEGCPPSLGGAIVLRGETAGVLKEVKRLARLALAAAYNLRLEQAYYRDRFAALPAAPPSPSPSSSAPPPLLLSTSLDVSFGRPHPTRYPREAGSLPPSVPEHQHILVTSVWMRERTQCSNAEVKRISYYYGPQDVSVGQFLSGSCFNPTLRCQNSKCQRTMLEHVMSFAHKDGRVTITTRRLPRPLAEIIASSSSSSANDDATDVTTRSTSNSNHTMAGALSTASGPHARGKPRVCGGGGGGGIVGAGGEEGHDDARSVASTATMTVVTSAAGGEDQQQPPPPPPPPSSQSGFGRPIYMCSSCKACGRAVTPLVEASDEAWKWSFGKFLEVFFYNSSARALPSVAGCPHALHRDHVLWFGCGDVAARFEYEPAAPYTVAVPSPRAVRFPTAYHEQALPRNLMKTWELGTLFFKRFQERLAEMQDEARDLTSVLRALASMGTLPPPSSSSSSAAATATAAAGGRDRSFSVASNASVSAREREATGGSVPSSPGSPAPSPPRAGGPGTRPASPAMTLAAAVTAPSSSSSSPSSPTTTTTTRDGDSQAQPQPATAAAAIGEEASSMPPPMPPPVPRPPLRRERSDNKDKGKEREGLAEMETELAALRREMAALEDEIQHSSATVAELLSQLVQESRQLLLATDAAAAAAASDDEEDEEEQEEQEEDAAVGASPSPRSDREEEEEENVPGGGTEGRKRRKRGEGRTVMGMGLRELEMYPAQCQRRLYLQALAWNGRVVMVGHGLEALRAQSAVLATAAGVAQGPAGFLSSSSSSLGQTPASASGQATPTTAATAAATAAAALAAEQQRGERPLLPLSTLNPARSGESNDDDGDGKEGLEEEQRQADEDATGQPAPKSPPPPSSPSSPRPQEQPQEQAQQRQEAAAMPAPVAIALPLPPPAPLGQPQRQASGGSVGTGGGGGGGEAASAGPAGGLEKKASLTLTASASAAVAKNPLAHALARLLMGKEYAAESPYAVELEDVLAAVGRLGLEPLRDGTVVPVVEEQPSTIIAYALSCRDYLSRFHELRAQALAPHQLSATLSSNTSKSLPTATATAAEASSSSSSSLSLAAGVGDNRSAPASPSPPSRAEGEGGSDDDEEEEVGKAQQPPAAPASASASAGPTEPSVAAAAGLLSSVSLGPADWEREMLCPDKSHIKVKFQDQDQHGEALVRFTVNIYWATQFHAFRAAFFARGQERGPNDDDDEEKDDKENDNEDEDQKTAAAAAAAAAPTDPGGDLHMRREASSSSAASASLGGEGDGAAYLLAPGEEEARFIKSLATSGKFDATGGKSGATFSITDDGRFVLKQINDKELAMFLDSAPAYFEYLAKALFHGHPTVLCSVLGLYETESHNRVTGRKVFSQLVVMPNIFFNRRIHRVYDLKGSTRSRYISLSEEDQRLHLLAARHAAQSRQEQQQQQQHHASSSDRDKEEKEKERDAGEEGEGGNAAAAAEEWQQQPQGVPPPAPPSPLPATALSRQATPEDASGRKSAGPGAAPPASPLPSVEAGASGLPQRVIRRTLLDENLLEFTGGRPLPLLVADQRHFMTAMANDTAFLSFIKIIDYSVLVGVDEERRELVVALIDWLRQYDIIKKMERMGKSVGMIAGQAEPTIIQPQPYRTRFQAAMERYFTQVPDKWTAL